MVTTYHKVIKQIAQNTDIKLITRDIDNVKHIFIVKGFSPYCFVSEANEHFLEDNSYVARKYDDGFRNLWDGSPMITAIFHHPANVGSERKRIGDDILYQADVHYELACTVMKNIGRYIRIEGDIRVNELYVDRIYPMNQYEKESMQFPDYHLIFLDIEVLGDPFEFPSVYEADKEVVSIVTSDINGKTDIWFYGDPTVKTVKNKILGMSGKVRSFSTEQTMIEACFEYCNLYDVGIAWNSKFDEEYLINRSKKLGLNCDWRIIQWFNLQQSVAMAQEFATDYLALKMIFEDLYMYKRHAWKYLPEIFQDYFTEEEGKNVEDRGKGMATLNKESLIYKYIQFRKGQSGADVKELYESGKFKELIFYNACDVWDMLMLTKVATIDSYFRLFDGLELLRLNDLFYHTARIEPLALKFCMINKVASPSRRIQEGIIEEGAIVHNPTQGRVLENVIVLDFSRFYISIIMAKEISPENQGENPKKLFYKMPNGDSFDEPMFFLPALAKYLIDQRNYAEDRVLEADDIITKEYWKSQTRSLKTITSGLWGYIAQNGRIRDEKTNEVLPLNKQKKAGRYYAEHVPNEILQESRNKTMELKKYMDETPIGGYYYNVVYGDTDATFLERKGELISDIEVVDPELIASEVNVFFEQLCKDQGYPYPILVKADKMYDKLVLVSKKFYYGRVVWEDGKFLETPKYDVKGMQAKRSDHSQLAKDFQYSIIQNHLAEGDSGIRKTIQRMNERTTAGLQEKGDNFLESISLPWKVKKPLIKYESGVWKFWSASAKLWNAYVRLNGLGIENQIKQNDKVFIMLIKYCGIKGLPIKNQYLIFPRASLVDWSKVEIDRFAMEEKTVKEKITNILTSLGWEPQRIRSMSKGRSTQRARF